MVFNLFNGEILTKCKIQLSPKYLTNNIKGTLMTRLQFVKFSKYLLITSALECV